MRNRLPIIIIAAIITTTVQLPPMETALAQIAPPAVTTPPAAAMHGFGFPERRRDTKPPDVSITQPVPNSAITGTFTIKAKATDASGVSGVQFYVDETPVGKEDRFPPYQTAWDSNAFTSGKHTVKARARDFFGNTAFSIPVQISISTGTTPPEPPSSNLILNPSLENATETAPQHWHTGSWGENDAVFSYPVAGFDGTNAAAVTIANYVSGDAKWFFDDVQIVAGNDYAYEERYKSTDQSAVIVRYTMSDGAYQYAEIGSPDASNDWALFTGTIIPPENAVSLTVFHVLRSTGTLTVDAFALKPAPSGPGPSSFDKGYVTLTFDDGWISQYTNARPMLKKAGLKATFFIIAQSALDAPQNNLTDQGSYTNAMQVRQLALDGFEIGSHSKTHPDLTTLSADQAKDEIFGSRQDLKSMGAGLVETFCYPYGTFNASLKQIVKDAGYVGARSVETGYVTKSADKYALKVQNVTAQTTAQEMRKWIDRAATNKTWLNIVFHQVDQSGTAYGTTPETLQQVVDYLKQKNISVITLSQGLKMLP